MSTVTTKDGIEIYYKDWGPKDAQPIVFHHGWPLSSDDWDNQMLFFGGKGYRVVGIDRRGHGRSTQASDGNDMDHYAADAAAVVEHLDLRNAVHIGHSTGGGEATRYVARHGQPNGRVAKLILIGAVPPMMVKTAASPGSLPIEVFDNLRKQLADNRSQFYIDLPTGPFYSFNRPEAKPSQPIIQNWWRQGMMGGAKAHYDGIKAFSETDFTEDLKVIELPTLVMHGDDDQIVPIANSALLSIKLLKNGTLKVCEKFPHGMCTTHADVVNPYLLAFIESCVGQGQGHIEWKAEMQSRRRRHQAYRFDAESHLWLGNVTTVDQLEANMSPEVSSKPTRSSPDELVPSRYAVRVGEIDVMVVSDGVLSLPGAMLGHNADPAVRAAWLNDMFLPPEMFEWALNAVVVRSGGRTILIDAGIGMDPGLNLPRAGRLVQRLEAAGIDLASVTDVVLTHMHMDHIGGLLVDGVKDRLRPDLQIHLAAAEAEFWASPDFSRVSMPPGFPDALRRTAKRFLNEYHREMRPFETEYEVAPGVVVQRTGGHTPGHSVVRLASDGHRLTFAGDAVFQVGFEHPDWYNGFEHDPEEAARVRVRLLRELAANRESLVATHLSFPSVCHVAVDGDVFRWVPGPWEY